MINLSKFLSNDKERELFRDRMFHDLFSTVQNIDQFVQSFGADMVREEKHTMEYAKDQLEAILKIV